MDTAFYLLLFTACVDLLWYVKIVTSPASIWVWFLPEIFGIETERAGWYKCLQFSMLLTSSSDTSELHVWLLSTILWDTCCALYICTQLACLCAEICGDKSYSSNLHFLNLKHTRSTARTLWYHDDWIFLVLCGVYANIRAWGWLI